jgi:hypothetical protein
MSHRDPADPELIRAEHEGTSDFAEVALARSGEAANFRFDLSADGRALLQRVLGTRPFATIPGLVYRYFYAGQGGRGAAPVTHLLYVRIEQGRDARTIEFESPADVVGALEWFRQLPSLAAAAHLRVTA